MFVRNDGFVTNTRVDCNRTLRRRQARTNRRMYGNPMLSGPVFVNHLELEKKAQKKAEPKMTLGERFSKFTKGLFMALAPTTAVIASTPVTESFDNSAVEIDQQRIDDIREALSYGDFDVFMNSEFVELPIDDVYKLFDVSDMKEPALGTEDEPARVIGKPAAKRKSKSETLKYLRHAEEIDTKELLTIMDNEDFGTIRPHAAGKLLKWAESVENTSGSVDFSDDPVYNWQLHNLQRELKSAMDSLKGPRVQEQILVLPNGEKCDVSEFLNAA